MGWCSYQLSHMSQDLSLFFFMLNIFSSSHFSTDGIVWSPLTALVIFFWTCHQFPSKECGSQIRSDLKTVWHNWVQIIALCLTNCVTLRKVFNLWDSNSSSVKWEEEYICWAVVRIKKDNIHKNKRGSLAGVAQLVGASSCKLRGFNSQLGHKPGLQVQSHVRVCMRGTRSMFLSCIDVPLPLCLPPPSV